jgi:hypothetical protein
MKSSKYEYVDEAWWLLVLACAIFSILGGLFLAYENPILIITRALTIGAAIVLIGHKIYEVRKKRYQWQVRRLMPRTIDNMGVNDGVRTLAITLISGETRMISVPEEYDVDDDGGELLMHLASPELFQEGGPLEGADFE